MIVRWVWLVDDVAGWKTESEHIDAVAVDVRVRDVQKAKSRSQVGEREEGDLSKRCTAADVNGFELGQSRGNPQNADVGELPTSGNAEPPQIGELLTYEVDIPGAVEWHPVRFKNFHLRHLLGKE